MLEPILNLEKMLFESFPTPFDAASWPSARPQKSLEIFAHQSPGGEIIDKGGRINCNTTPLVDDSTAGAFMLQKSQRLLWSGTSSSTMSCEAALKFVKKSFKNQIFRSSR